MIDVVIRRKYALMKDDYGDTELVKKFDNQEDLWDYLKTKAPPKDLMGSPPEYWIKDIFLPEEA